MININLTLEKLNELDIDGWFYYFNVFRIHYARWKRIVCVSPRCKWVETEIDICFSCTAIFCHASAKIWRKTTVGCFRTALPIHSILSLCEKDKSLSKYQYYSSQQWFLRGFSRSINIPRRGKPEHAEKTHDFRQTALTWFRGHIDDIGRGRPLFHFLCGVHFIDLIKITCMRFRGHYLQTVFNIESRMLR